MGNILVSQEMKEKNFYYLRSKGISTQIELHDTISTNEFENNKILPLAQVEEVDVDVTKNRNLPVAQKVFWIIYNIISLYNIIWINIKLLMIIK